MDAGRDRRLARLYWQCRRGMRELDLLLQGFIETAGPTLSGHDEAVFARLLEYPDVLLLEYLMGRQIPTDREIADVVARIRLAVAD